MTFPSLSYDNCYLSALLKNRIGRKEKKIKNEKKKAISVLLYDKY